MRKLRAITLLLVTGLLASGVVGWGQEGESNPKPASETAVRKLIQVRYASPNRLQSLLRDFGAAIRADDQMKAITVVGTRSAVDAVEEAIKALDVRQKDVELTAYVLSAVPNEAESGAIPPQLNDVVVELKKILNYKGFNLLSTLLIHTQDGESARTSGAVSGTADLTLWLQRVNITPGDKAPVIRIEGLNFQISQTKTATESKEELHTTGPAEIRTSIEIPVGQKVVVGKTALGTPDNAIILVMTAKVLD